VHAIVMEKPRSGQRKRLKANDRRWQRTCGESYIRRAPSTNQIAMDKVELHGQSHTYRAEGSGPLIVLLHGIAGSSATWERVIPRLSAHHRVIAPDLLGHGASAKPGGDYSLGAYATLIRDLLETLGEERGTVVGHSLGGGVAMQFAYQYPERCERLVLVSAGGLGREVHAILRAAALPGAELVLPWLSVAASRSIGTVVKALGRLGFRESADLGEAWRSFTSLEDRSARSAFLHTVRSVIDLRGQRVSATDKLYLAAGLPTLIVWGEQDPLIPVSHAYRTHELIPGSRLEVFSGVGHYPYLDDPERFAAIVLDFIQTTAPAEVDPNRLRSRLQTGSGRPAAE
jgi:pimeloyl-ACP methyl ester carboxylesterase